MLTKKKKKKKKNSFLGWSLQLNFSKKKLNFQDRSPALHEIPLTNQHFLFPNEFAKGYSYRGANGGHKHNGFIFFTTPELLQKHGEIFVILNCHWSLEQMAVTLTLKSPIFTGVWVVFTYEKRLIISTLYSIIMNLCSMWHVNWEW